MFRDSVQLDAADPVLLLSDLHFGDGSRTDLFRGQDRDLIDFLERERTRVGTIVFLGDIVDMPQAWSTRRVRRAHPELWAYLTRLVRDERVLFARGNHDWSVDYESLFPGSTRCEAVRIGDRVLAWHGHQVDLVMSPQEGNAKLSTYAHALLERATGRRLVPPLERYDSVPNRIAMATTILWGRMSMARAQALKKLGRDDRARAIEDRVRYLARSMLGDPADIFGATERTVLGNGYHTVVCGHTHVPGVVSTSRGTYVNTGTWAIGMRTATYWNGERFRVVDLLSGRDVGDEWFTDVPAETEAQDLFHWWDEHHTGFLRFDL